MSNDERPLTTGALAEALARTEARTSERLDARLAGTEARSDAKFDHVDSWFTTMEERFERVDSRFTTMEERFERVDSWFTTMEERFGAKLATFESSIKTELRSEMGAMERRLSYQIGDSASRTANVVIERFADMIKVIDDRVRSVDENARSRTESLHTEVRGLRAALDAHVDHSGLHGNTQTGEDG